MVSMELVADYIPFVSLGSQLCAFSFHGQVVYGFIPSNFLPNSCLLIFTFELIYVIIYIVFIYSFIYSVTSFPVESWVSMPYEHREKPVDLHPL